VEEKTTTKKGLGGRRFPTAHWTTGAKKGGHLKLSERSGGEALGDHRGGKVKMKEKDRQERGRLEKFWRRKARSTTGFRADFGSEARYASGGRFGGWGKQGSTLDRE